MNIKSWFCKHNWEQISKDVTYEYMVGNVMGPYHIEYTKCSKCGKWY